MQLLTGPWPARAAWAALPLTLGPALAAALEGASRAVQLTGSGLAWLGWAGVLAATLVPRTTSLTALRIAAPVPLVLAGWAGGWGEAGAAAVVGAGWAAVTLVAAFAPTTGHAFVNGSSYGEERRFLLRMPSALALGPLLVAWLGAVAPPLAAPLLLAAQSWLAGAAVAAAGVPAALAGARALHGLTRRWAVLVPAGLVLHDPMSLADPVLFPRAMIARLGIAPAGTDGLDLTQGALGLALELELVSPQPITLARARWRGRRTRAAQAQRLVFCPTRPGVLLAEAARRRLPVA